VGDQVLEESLVVRKDPDTTLSDAQLAQLFDVRTRQLRLNATLTMAIRQSDEVRQQITQAKAAMEGVTVPESVTEMADGLEEELGDIRRRLGGGGGGFGGGGRQSDPPSLRQLLSVAAGVHRATAMPTEQEMSALNAVPQDLDSEVGRLNDLVARLPAFYQALDAAGVPWTPGRPVR
jgi:hypothetical protein